MATTYMKDFPLYSQERAEEYKRRGWAPDDTLQAQVESMAKPKPSYSGKAPLLQLNPSGQPGILNTWFKGLLAKFGPKGDDAINQIIKAEDTKSTLEVLLKDLTHGYSDETGTYSEELPQALMPPEEDYGYSDETGTYSEELPQVPQAPMPMFQMPVSPRQQPQ